MKKFLSILLLSAFSILFGCHPDDHQEDSQNNSSDSFSENFGNEVSRNFIGQVVDINSSPVAHAAVKIGTSTVQTDVNGVFIINGAEVYEQFAYITVKKPGYIDGSRSMIPTNGKNNVKIMLIQSTPVQTISSGSSSEVALSSGTKVTFDGAFEDENGNAYSGNVSVSMYHLESSNENLSSLMPGMLYAQTDTGEEAMLQTFGMLNVELMGSSGQKLQIAGGHTASIEMVIDPLQSTTAPATIPLWHFDESKGYWIQEGNATKVGDKYVGNVSHFSWWNCDTFYATVSLTVTVQDTNGNPAFNTGVGLTIPTMTSYIQFTDNNGQVSGLIPKDEVLTVNIYDICGNTIYTASVGPFNSDTILPVVIIEPAQAQPTVIKGKLLNCDGTTVANGYVYLRQGDLTLISAVTNGAFEFSTVVCGENANFVLQGYDYVNLQSTGEMNYYITPGTTNVGDLHVCNAITEYIMYQLNDLPPNYITENINMVTPDPGMLFNISALPPNNNPNAARLVIYGSTSTPGLYHLDEFAFFPSQYYPANNYNASYNYAYVPGSTTSDIRLLSYGEIGEYIDISFSVTKLTGAGTETSTLTGYAHVIREY